MRMKSEILIGRETSLDSIVAYPGQTRLSKTRLDPLIHSKLQKKTNRPPDHVLRHPLIYPGTRTLTPSNCLLNNHMKHGL